MTVCYGICFIYTNNTVINSKCIQLQNVSYMCIHKTYTLVCIKHVNSLGVHFHNIFKKGLNKNKM